MPATAPVDSQLFTSKPGGDRVSLSGEGWLLKHSPPGQGSLLSPPTVDDSWLPAHVPATAQANLLAAGLIPDPYVDENNRELRWMEEQAWWFARRIAPSEIPSSAGRIILQFDGVDYFCRVWLNGRLLGAHEGMFGGPQFDVTGHLDTGGENLLVVGFAPPPLPDADEEEDIRKQRVHAFSSAERRDGLVRRHYRTVFNQGWAYLRLATTGIWQDVRLVGLGPVNISGVSFATRGLARDCSSAQVQVGFAVEGAPADCEGAGAEVTLSFGDRVLAREILAPCTCEDRREELSLAITNPPLWHPNGFGPQHLCLLTIRLLDRHGNGLDTVERPVGIRQVRLLPNPGPGELYNWTFEVNHQRFFARGFNWVPRDAMLRVDGDAYIQHLHSMAATGANMVRVWGWGLVETDAFYDLCDRLGLMVWQEFPITHGQHDDDNLEVLDAQVRWIVDRLRTRASLTMWSGGNELHLLDPTRSSDVLDYLEDLVPRLDPDHPYRRTSPYGGDHHFGGCAQDESVYANHESYLVKPKDPAARDNYAFPALSWINCALHLEDLSFRRIAFVSEIPTPTIMPERSLRKAVDPAELEKPLSDLPLASTHPRIRHHCDLQFDWFPAIAARASQFGNLGGRPFRELIPLFQYQQAIAYQAVAESFRGNWPRTSGLLYWVYNSPSPVNTWEVMDWYGVPLPSYYFIKRAFGPELVVARFRRMYFAPGEEVRVRHTFLQDPTPAPGRERIISGRLLTSGLDIVDQFHARIRVGGELAFKDACPDFVHQLPMARDWQSMIYLLDLKDVEGNLLSRRHYILRIDSRVEDGEFLQRTRDPMAHMRIPDNGGKLWESVLRSTTSLSLEVDRKEDSQGGAQLTIRNTGDVAAFMVELECDKMESVIFSDNYFLLLPGEEQLVDCWSPAGVDPGGFRVSAWNCPSTDAFDSDTGMIARGVHTQAGGIGHE